MKILFVFLFAAFHLIAAPVETFYGTLEITEPVLLELIESNPMQRLKKLHQYGVAYYTTHKEEYNRYDHSVGVFAILRMKEMSLKEQIAGLLHDVSHTAFSHVGDYLFRMEEAKDSYQDGIHEWYLKASGIGAILKKHGYEIRDVLPKAGQFEALEKELPNLCADRIDYNLQGAFYRGFLSKVEAKEILDQLVFKEGEWIAPDTEALRKMARFSVFMTMDCWSSPHNYFTSHALSQALRRAVELKLISKEDIFFGVDEDLWKKLIDSKDAQIRESMQKTLQATDYFSIENGGEAKVKLKFRGIDPKLPNGKRLTDSDPIYAKQYGEAKQKIAQGWTIKEKNK